MMDTCVNVGNLKKGRIHKKIIVLFLSSLGITYLMYVLHSNTAYTGQRRQHTALVKMASLEEPRSNDCSDCFAYNYNRILKPKGACNTGDNVVVMLLITSIPGEIRDRDAMRKSWLPLNTGAVRHVFMFGETTNKTEQMVIQKEHEMYGDIIQDDFVESYYNLSHKVIMGFKWVAEECPQAHYIVRTACDNYINIPQVLELVSEFKHEVKNAWFGLCTTTAPVVRTATDRWFISRRHYGKSVYPPYCVGTTFVMPFDVMINFLKVSANTPFFPLEDCYFGFVALKFQVDIVTVKGFNSAYSWNGTSKVLSPHDVPVFSLHPVRAHEHSELNSIEKSRALLSKSELRSSVKLDYVNRGWWNRFRYHWAANAPEAINLVEKL